MEWAFLTSDGIDGWIRDIQKHVPPRHHRVLAPATARERLAALRVENDTVLRGRVFVRDDSGTVEVDVPLGPAMPGPAVPDLVALARRVDERGYYFQPANPEHLPASIHEGELHSQVDEIDVVGPGGRVIVYRISRGLRIDIAVRRREQSGSVSSAWREPTLIMDGIRPRLEGLPTGALLRCTFGYFEASKYERQDWLRPVFLIVANQARQQDAPRRVLTVIEDATLVS